MDFDTDSNYPQPATTADPGDLAFEELQRTFFDLSTKLNGYESRIFTDADGNQWEAMLRPAGISVQSVGAWGLVEGEDGYQLIPGRIYTSGSTLESELTIEDADTVIDPANDDATWLELTNIYTTPEITLKTGKWWDDYPATTDTEVDDDGYTRLTTVYIPIFSFHDDALPELTAGFNIAGRHALQFLSSPALQLIFGDTNFDEENRRVSIPILVSR